VRAIFLPLSKLQKNIDQDNKANAILLSAKNEQAQAAAEQLIKEKFTIGDLGLKLRVFEEQRAISLESDSAVISNVLAEKATATPINNRESLMRNISFPLRGFETDGPFEMSGSRLLGSQGPFQ